MRLATRADPASDFFIVCPRSSERDQEHTTNGPIPVPHNHAGGALPPRTPPAYRVSATATPSIQCGLAAAPFLDLEIVSPNRSHGEHTSLPSYHGSASQLHAVTGRISGNGTNRYHHKPSSSSPWTRRHCLDCYTLRLHLAQDLSLILGHFAIVRTSGKV